MSTVVDTARRQKDEYTDGADRPLGSYLGTLAVYGLTTAAMVLVGRRLRGSRRPTRRALSSPRTRPGSSAPR